MAILGEWAGNGDRKAGGHRVYCEAASRLIFDWKMVAGAESGIQSPTLVPSAMPVFRSLPLATLLVASLAMAACKDDQSKVAEAAARMVQRVQPLAPDDVQIVSLDGRTALEIIGDSVHIYHENSIIHVPATHVENVKYADGRLRFDIKGIGVKVFEVGDGTEGASFTQSDALEFVSVVLSRQNDIEAAGRTP